MEGAAPRDARRWAHGSVRGFTLVEILVVICLIAVLAGTIVSGSGMMSSNRLRAAAGLVVTGVRLAITRANTTGHPIRLTFDIDASRLMMEETTDRMLRIKETGNEAKGSEGASAGADPATEAEKQSVAYADGILKGRARARNSRRSPSAARATTTAKDAISAAVSISARCKRNTI